MDYSPRGHKESDVTEHINIHTSLGSGKKNTFIMYTHHHGFPRSSVSNESACSARDLGSIPGSGRSPGEGNGKPLQYPRLENPMDRGTWQATVCGVPRVGHDLVSKPLLLLLLNHFSCV